jgi:hypothetical protein
LKEINSLKAAAAAGFSEIAPEDGGAELLLLSGCFAAPSGAEYLFLSAGLAVFGLRKNCWCRSPFLLLSITMMFLDHAALLVVQHGIAILIYCT